MLPLCLSSCTLQTLSCTKTIDQGSDEEENSCDAEMHSNDHAKGLKWQQKASIAQAALVAPLQSGVQIRHKLHRDLS